MVEKKEKVETFGVIKHLEVELDGDSYILEYSRDVIKRMEDRGFNITQVEEKFVTNLDMLVDWAFFMHQPTIKGARLAALRDKLYEEYDCEELFPLLCELVTNCLPQNVGNATKKSLKIVRG